MGWFLELNAKQLIELGNERKEAFDRYHQLMAGQSPTVSEILDVFLDWCRMRRTEKTNL